MNRRLNLEEWNERDHQPTYPSSSEGSLREWRVENFKALEYASVAFPALTVLTGPNSSGKSSYVQSLLLFAQSPPGPTVLNGDLAVLGDASSVISEGEDQVTFGMSLVNPDEGQGNEAPHFEYQISFSSSLSGSLVPTEVHLASGETHVLSAETKVGPRASKDPTKAKGRAQGPFALTVTEAWDESSESTVEILISGFYPESLVLREDSKTLRKRLSNYFDAAAVAGDPVKAAQLVAEVRNLAKPDDANADDHAIYMSILEAGSPAAVIQKLADTDALPRVLQNISTSEPRLKERVFPIGSGKSFSYWGWPANQSPYADLGLLADVLTSLNESLRGSAEQILYLGPLRSDPDELSRTGPTSPHAPVGTSGELTARVLNDDSQTPIWYNDWDDTRHLGTLSEAVAKWVDYLKIGEGVETDSYGRYGHGALIKVGGQSRDLSSVGVGASQLLPVLVLVLTAPPRSIVLIEQPELHLHPSVQHRLADLFLYARPDVNFVIETHSEYLVTRIRRRLVEGKTQPKDVAVYFAKKVEGYGELSPLTLSTTGDFDEWPTGFFDTQDIEVLGLVRALRKQWDIGDM